MAATRATVKSELLSVYSERNETGIPVKSLRRGDPVLIEIMFAGEDGQWCGIRQPDQAARLGYVRCESLQRATAAVAAVQAQPGDPRPASLIPPAPGRDERIVEASYMRNAWNFATLLRFTPEQWEQLPVLARQTGVAECIDQMEAAYRSYGLPTTKTAADRVAAGNRERMRLSHIAMMRAWAASRRVCSLRELDLSEKTLDLATPEQQQIYGAELKALRNIVATRRSALSAAP